MCSEVFFDVGNEHHGGFLFVTIPALGHHIDAPFLNVASACLNQGDRAIKTSSRIPTATFLHILQMYSQGVGGVIAIHNTSNVDIERCVAVFPFAHFLSVHIHFWFCHRTVEVEDNTLAFLIHFEAGAIPTLPNPRESA